MKVPRYLSAILVGVLLGALLFVPSDRPVEAALWWFHGVRSAEISLCFAGNAVTQRPNRVREIVTHLQEFEYAANIRFVTTAGTRARDEIQPGGDINKLACPAPTTVDGKSYYDGDIRVALWSTDVPVDPPGKVPGVGCTQDKVGSSWSNPPDELEAKRPCQYNLKLGDDDLDMQTNTHTGTPWLNHTLHEFGHALGLAHEHARKDENAGCVPSSHDEYRATSAGYLTPYDKNSIMHYRFWPSEVPSCVQSGSNYSNDGLTAYDRLALHILYPQENRVAEFVGTTVIPARSTLSLQAAWKAQGANMSVVASNFVWRLGGAILSNTPDLNVTLSTPGTHTLEFSYTDFLGRSYSYSGPVRVLSEEDYRRQIVAPIAASLPLLYPNHYISTAGISLNLGQHVALSFGSNTFTDTVVLDYADQLTGDGGGLVEVGPFFELGATYLSSGQPAQAQPGKTYSMAVTYQESSLPPWVDEDELALYAWNGSRWIKEETSQVDVSANVVMAMPNHFSSWAVLAKPHVYLPAVLR